MGLGKTWIRSAGNGPQSGKIGQFATRRRIKAVHHAHEGQRDANERSTSVSPWLVSALLRRCCAKA